MGNLLNLILILDFKKNNKPCNRLKLGQIVSVSRARITKISFVIFLDTNLQFRFPKKIFWIKFSENIAANRNVVNQMATGEMQRSLLQQKDIVTQKYGDWCKLKSSVDDKAGSQKETTEIGVIEEQVKQVFKDENEE